MSRQGKPAGLRPLDVLIITLIAAGALFSGYIIYGNRGETARLTIESPEGTWVYGLDTDRTVEIPGKLGKTVIRISGGNARITESACPNKTCVAAPPISKKGEWNACLPNEVLIRISGDASKSGIDAVGY